MLHAVKSVGAQPRLRTALARNIAEIRAAQRLRYRVFAEEMGARVPGREQGIDCDVFDAYCDHLIVTDTASGDVVGTYRLLNGAQARRAGGFYADQEFDLARLDALREHAVEAGRACIHPQYRGGGVLAMLWAGIVEYTLTRGARYLIGCASLSLADGGAQAAAIYRSLAATQTAPDAFRVTPHTAWPVTAAAHGDPSLPALLRGYRKLGAWVCGEPAWDPDFNCADLFLLLATERLDARYLQRLARG